MKKEEYMEHMKVLNEKMAEITAKKLDLNSLYIETNKPLNLGDKIETDKGEQGIVYAFEINTFSKDVLPLLKKVKKDGTASQQNLWMSRSRTYTKVE